MYIIKKGRKFIFYEDGMYAIVNNLDSATRFKTEEEAQKLLNGSPWRFMNYIIEKEVLQ